MSAHVVAVRDDEILTGEAVVLDVQPLGLMMRALGALIDVAIGWVLYIGFMLFVAMLADIGVIGEAVVRILSVVGIVLAFVALPVAVEAATRGRSVGKLAVGGRVVRADGGAVGFRHAFIRALVGVLEIYMTMGALAFIVGAFTPRAQRLGDLAAGTYAERTRTPKVAESTLTLPPPLIAWAHTVDVGRLPVRLARRLSMFVEQGPTMAPYARQRLATQLAAEAAPYVLPVPPVDPETFLRGVVCVRRDREYRAITLENQRAATLLAGA